MVRFFFLLCFLMIFFINPCYSKDGKSKIPDVVLKVEFYERKANGNDTPLFVKKSFILKIEDEDGGSITRTVGVDTDRIDIPLKKSESAAFDYKEGKKIRFQILPEWESNSRWKIVSPANGKIYLPGNLNNPIKIIFERIYPLYAVQAISTENETTASRLRDRLNEDMPKYSKFCLKTDKDCISKCPKKVTVDIEKYMAFNMPSNGFNYKVKLGYFEEKDCAVSLKEKLFSLYKQEYGFFVTLKDEK